MKMKQEHYDYIKNRISIYTYSTAKYYYENIKNDPRVKDINKCFRWDLFYASIAPKYTCDNLYPYLNDDHIDTALKKDY